MKQFSLLLILAGALFLVGCDSPSPTATESTPTEAVLSVEDAILASQTASDNQYVFLFKGNKLPKTFASDVEQAGGAVIFQHDIGFAFVDGLDATAAAQFETRNYVAEMQADLTFDLDLPSEIQTTSAPSIASPEDPTDAFFFPIQWHQSVIGSDKAWAAGEFGSTDVTIGILDTGIGYDNDDLRAITDLERSVSFLPDQDALVRQFFPSLNVITDLQFHGTHVAGTAASQAFTASGVTSQTTLVGIRTCRIDRSCSFGAIISGVLYAADNGIDVANLSLGGTFDRAGSKGMVGFINRTFNYARRKGVTVVVSAGNSATDLDKDGSLYANFCDTPNTICVSATGPAGFETPAGPYEDIDAVAPYSNFGSAIDVAAPGGFALPVYAVCSPSSIVIPECQQEGIALGISGTSMAAPHVSGLAALLVQKYGRKPGRIKTAIQNSADDLGKPGTDPFYGKGRINVAKALGLE